MSYSIMDEPVMYLQVIKDAYPGLVIYSARLHTGEGQFNDILFINDDLIFRFPRYKDSIDAFLQEIDILQRLQDKLSLPIPCPIYYSEGTRSVGEVFMGYKSLPGKPLFREVMSSITDITILENFARQLADFLQGLHSLTPAELELNLPFTNELATSKQLYASIQDNLFEFMRPDARDSVIEHFETYFNSPSLHGYEPSMIHGDFGGSNILFERDRLTGVIDFSFAGPGDPAVDIAAVSTYGESFFARFCNYYSPSESMQERARFYRGTFALQEALHGFRNHDPEAFNRGMEQYL